MNVILGKYNIYGIYLFLIVFIFYTIFEQIYNLTQTYYIYNSKYDYGKLLNGLCGKEHFEYETSRFHISDNINQYKLNNDNKTRYILFIVIITIIISINISFIFSYITYNLLINYLWMVDKFDQNDSNDLLTIIFKIIYRSIAFLAMPYKVFKRLFMGDTGKITMINILFFICSIIFYLAVIFILISIPLYIGLKLSSGIDISPLNDENKLYPLWIIFFIILFIVHILYYIFKSGDRSNAFVDYFSSNIYYLFIKNNVDGLFLLVLWTFIYLATFFILGNVLNIYKYPYTQPTEKKIMDTSSFMNNVIGYTEYNNFHRPNVFIKDISGMIIIILAIIFIIISLYVLFTLFIGINISSQNLDIIKYNVILPFIAIIILIYAYNLVTEYNTYINKFLIEDPIIYYKKIISEMNTIFNKYIGLTDYNNIKSTSINRISYIGRNIGNGILLTLYSNIFKDFPADINILPEFIFDNERIQMDVVKFTTDEYNINYYLNSKNENRNIFYIQDKCTELNDMIYYNFLNNISIFHTDYKDEITLKYQMIHDLFYTEDHNTAIKYQDKYIRTELIEKSANLNKVLNELQQKMDRQLRTSIYNVSKLTVFNDKSKSIIFKSGNGFYNNLNQKINITIGDIHINNNNIFKNHPEDIEAQIPKEYDKIINIIISKYSDLICYNLYAYTPVYQYRKYNSNDTEKEKEFITEYLKKMSISLKNFFDEVVYLLSLPLDEKKLNVTDNIITNYNNANDKMYKENILQTVNVNLLEYVDKDIIGSFKIYVSKMNLIYDSLKNINTENDNKTSTKLQTDIINIEIEINNLLEDFQKLNTDLNFKNNINSILINNQNQYDLVYEIKDVGLDKGNTNMVNNNMYDISLDILNLKKIIIKNIKQKYEEISKYSGNNILNINNIQILAKYNQVINDYMKILDKNIKSIQRDCQNFDDKNDIDNENLNDIKFTKNISLNILDKAKKADKLIYLLIINYIVLIISTNLIIV